MPVSDHYNRYEKLAVRIITVDTSALRVEGVGKDAAVIQISVSHRPPGFRWPIEGELWIAERQGTDWTLVSKMEDPDSLALSDGEPGDLMGPDGYIPQHEIKATSGQGLLWTTDGWVPQNIATQAELDAVNANLLAADSGFDARLDILEDVRSVNAGTGIGTVAFTTDGTFTFVRKGNPATTPFYLEVVAGVADQTWEVQGGYLVVGTSPAWVGTIARVVMTSDANETVIANGQDCRSNVHNALTYFSNEIPPSSFVVPAGTTRRFHLQNYKNSPGNGASYYNHWSGGEGPWIRGRRLA